MPHSCLLTCIYVVQISKNAIRDSVADIHAQQPWMVSFKFEVNWTFDGVDMTSHIFYMGSCTFYMCPDIYAPRERMSGIFNEIPCHRFHICCK